MVQSVTGQAVVAPVDQAVGDGASQAQTNGAGSSFDLTGLLDTVSANAELSGVPPIEAPPAALAVAALKANAGLAAAAVSKPLDVESLSSVDAGLASLLMLKQTVSRGLVASAEAKMPVYGKPGDLANINLTLKFTPQTPQMPPLAPQPMLPLDQAADAAALLADLGLVGQPITPVAPQSGQTLNGQPLMGQNPAPVDPQALGVDPSQIVPVDGSVIPVAPVAEAVPVDPRLAGTVQPQTVGPDGQIDLAPLDQGQAASVDPAAFIVLDPALESGFKRVVVREGDQTLVKDPAIALTNDESKTVDGAGLGVLNVTVDLEPKEQSVLAELADGFKSVVKDAGKETGFHITLSGIKVDKDNVSALAQAAGLTVRLSSQVASANVTTATALAPSLTGAANGQAGLLAVPAAGSAKADSDQAEPLSVQTIVTHGHAVASQGVEIVGQGMVAPQADPSLMVQQQVVVASSQHGHMVAQQAAATQAASMMAPQSAAAPVIGGVGAKPSVKVAGAPVSDAQTADNDVVLVAADQIVVQRQAEAATEMDQQAGLRQRGQQVADRQLDETAAVKAKASESVVSGDAGQQQSSDQPQHQASGEQKQTLAAANTIEHETASTTLSAGNMAIGDGFSAGSVQSGGSVADTSLSRAIMNVQYAMTGSSAVRMGQATAAEMRFQSLGQQVLAALRSNAQEIELTLNPSQLGQVILKLNVDGTKVRVSAKTESRMTDEALKAGEGELKASLQAQGFVLDGFDVSHDDDQRRAPQAETEGAQVASSDEGEAFSIDLIA